MSDSEKVRLTQYAQGAGCASKVRASDLARILAAFPMQVDPKVVIGLNPADDAAVIRMTDELSLVFTTDFFAPLVDDPRTYGRIAATNAISDIYAMGAVPLVALNIVAFPSKVLGLEVLGEILRGGAEAAQAAGISIAGGHSVEDAEPKYGLAVIGTVHPSKVWTKGGARAGDKLVLTKALGTGVLATALKRGAITEDSETMQAAIRSMTTLNARAAEVTKTLGIEVHAATDVTGYGLAGHLGEVLRGSAGVSARLSAAALPLLDGALQLVRDGVLAGGTKANRTHVSGWFSVAEGVDDSIAWLACDAQTSGGLLIACPAADAERLTAQLALEGLRARVIGEIVASESPVVHLDA